MNDTIIVDQSLTLEQIQEDDAHDLVREIGTKGVYDNVLKVPHPYSLSDAISWIRFVEKQKNEFDELLNWCIKQDGVLIGGIGFHNLRVQPHRDEFGYFIGESHWGKGIMTKVIGAFSEFAYNERKITRLEAPVYTTNIASQKVLEKNGFEREGLLKKAYMKDGSYKDAYMYAKVR